MKELVAVVDASRPGTATLEKEKAFPLQARDRGYIIRSGSGSVPRQQSNNNPYEPEETGDDGYENVTPDGRILSMSAFIPMSGGSFDGSLYDSND